MQADERKIGSPKQVGLNGETLVINQVSPLHRSPKQERGSKNKCQRPPPREGADSCIAKRPHSQMNTYAAREQKDREHDRNMKNVLGRRSASALPQVEQVGNDEYRKNRGLCSDQAIHSE